MNLISSDHGLGTTRVHVPKRKINLADNYSADLKASHQIIRNALSDKNISGLVLLHGKPGTGKSTYLNFLLSQLDKEVFLLSPRILNSLDHPEMINTLLRMEDSILVVEDAEELIESRDKNRSSAIAWLLNLTDGLLGDALKMKVICTFNTSLKNIDEALLRKGRLIARHEFRELNIEQSKNLLRKIGIENPIVNSPMTLADIYQYRQNNFQIEQKQIGFKVS